jgi:hypothetical protein
LSADVFTGDLGAVSAVSVSTGRADALDEGTGRMSTHTPGPWEVEGDDESLWVTPLDRSTPVICDMVEREGETEANAHLIAAAPDLLAACKAFIAADPAEGYSGAEYSALKLMHAAIAKAEGKGQAV